MSGGLGRLVRSQGSWEGWPRDPGMAVNNNAIRSGKCTALAPLTTSISIRYIEHPKKSYHLKACVNDSKAYVIKHGLAYTCKGL